MFDMIYSSLFVNVYFILGGFLLYYNSLYLLQLFIMGCNSILALSVFLGSVLTHFEACSFHPKILQNIYCDSDFGKYFS